MSIKLSDCKSSQIHSHGYDPQTKTLAIRFYRTEGGKRVPGPIYHYEGFTEDDYKSFCGAESLGKHFGTHIKGDKFKFKKMGD